VFVSPPDVDDSRRESEDAWMEATSASASEGGSYPAFSDSRQTRTTFVVCSSSHSCFHVRVHPSHPKCQSSTTASLKTSPTGRSPNRFSSQHRPLWLASISTSPPRASRPPHSQSSLPRPVPTSTQQARAPKRSRTSTRMAALPSCSAASVPRLE